MQQPFAARGDGLLDAAVALAGGTTERAAAFAG
jgi:hypothetical protein